MVGGWTPGTHATQYATDFLQIGAGTGQNKVLWEFKAPRAGTYRVQAWWPSAQPNATAAAPFVVRHAAGDSTVLADQSAGGGAWVELGQFSFNAGPNLVTLTDAAADNRTVLADALRIVYGDDPTVYDQIIDNKTYPTTHLGVKTMLFRNELEIPKSDLRYSRLFLDLPQSGRYYLQNLGRGIVFYSVPDTHGHGSEQYLKGYLQGKTDAELWEMAQSVEAVYDYYDFNKGPWEQE